MLLDSGGEEDADSDVSSDDGEDEIGRKKSGKGCRRIVWIKIAQK